MKITLAQAVAGLVLFAQFTVPAQALDRQILHGHVPAAVAKLHLQPTGHLAATNRIYMVIGPQLHNENGLTNLLRQLYDPASANFHRYLTPQEINENFVATDAEYQKILQFVRSNGLTVVHTYGDRRIVDVGGTAADIEKTFHVHLLTYQHPTENRQFYAPDVEPSVDAGVPIRAITGLNNYFLPHPKPHRKPLVPKSKTDYTGGTGPGGVLWGKDYRNAYAPGVTLTGAGQSVGLVEFGNYLQSDITSYEALTGLPNVPLINVVPDCSPSDNADYAEECTLDIEMVVSMAPGLANVYVFQGEDPNSVCEFFSGGNYDDLLQVMVGYTQISQFSSSVEGFGFDDNIGGFYLQVMALQGQSFFQSSGDNDAQSPPSMEPEGTIYATVVGGTALGLDNTGTNYYAETVWNDGDGTGSSGGVNYNYALPWYQTNINMSAVGGSEYNRNVPDVACVAYNIGIFDNGTNTTVEGTSAATPLWAAFIALVNEQAANQGLFPVGFLNPALYGIGQSSIYTGCFHDITTGNNFNSNNYNFGYTAAPGYDLCTGWGTPNGQNMINALVAYAGVIWVDFAYFGGYPYSSSANGSALYPFPTLDSGIAAVPTNGTIVLVGPNTTNETIHISKPMTIRAADGWVSIGK